MELQYGLPKSLMGWVDNMDCDTPHPGQDHGAWQCTAPACRFNKPAHD